LSHSPKPKIHHPLHISRSDPYPYSYPCSLTQLSDRKKRETNTVNPTYKNSRERQEALEIEVLANASIITTTLSSSGIVQKLKNFAFDTVLIDEAAQAVEVFYFFSPLFKCNQLSTLIPLKYGCKHCILVGDPKQLPATVLSKLAGDHKYMYSLMERLIDCGHPYYLLDSTFS
jgi:senataxin